MQTHTTPDEKTLQGIAAALGRIPQGLFILTARHEDRRGAALVSWVQQASFSPPMVSLAIAKGRSILPLISESRFFGLCQLPKGDKLLMRHFAGGSTPNEDPFLGMDLLPNHAARVPLLAGALSYMECEVVRHIDVEGDHDVFVAAVRTAGYLAGEPHIHLRDNGLKY